MNLYLVWINEHNPPCLRFRASSSFDAIEAAAIHYGVDAASASAIVVNKAKDDGSDGFWTIVEPDGSTTKKGSKCTPMA